MGEAYRIVTPSGIPIPGTHGDTPEIAKAAYSLVRGVVWETLAAQGYGVIRYNARGT